MPDVPEGSTARPRRAMKTVQALTAPRAAGLPKPAKPTSKVSKGQRMPILLEIVLRVLQCMTKSVHACVGVNDLERYAL